MNETRPVPGPQRVADWPKITAKLNLDGSGTITVNGSERPCAAASVEELRTGITARCVAIATGIRRPVRLTVTEPSGTWQLAVRPEGVVQLLDDAGMIPPADGLTVDEGRCRHCRRLQSVTETRCAQCGIAEPHRVELAPLTCAGPAPLGIDSEPEQSPPAVDDLALTRLCPPVPDRPTLRLHFNTQETVDVTGNAAIGRNPSSIDGRHPVSVASPGRMLSRTHARTHALLDLDEAGHIVVTDHHSGNGVETLTDPPMWLIPFQPYVIQSGTTLRMGDVECTPEVVCDTPT
ncbi:FHA domain-containing protein [Cryobacterium melibiosiphilum]|uniref:FHA domain-containing protein n=1 Tax=Cryobacterium melibiosiphilum TaxID=995039 RepID=UPI0011C24071|nr:FHA domain-containing protein [Cryobacterium melibiosiphilum]